MYVMLCFIWIKTFEFYSTLVALHEMSFLEIIAQTNFFLRVNCPQTSCFRKTSDKYRNLTLQNLKKGTALDYC